MIEAVQDPLLAAACFAALGLGAWNAWLHHPQAPELEAERWFKVALATLLRGAVEARGGGAADWEEAVVRFVPYSPLGRVPEAKVDAPGLWSPPLGAALRGERALVQALAALPDAPARWRRLYDQDPEALAARLADPAELGSAYDPSRGFGGAASWDALAQWGAGDPAFGEAVSRRLRARWALIGRAVEGVPALLPVLGAELGVPVWEKVADSRQILAQLQALVPAPADRVVVVVEGWGVLPTLAALVEDPALRDRVLAVLSVGGVIRGLPEAPPPWQSAAAFDWLEANFRHDRLDTDAVRWTPYLSLGWISPQASPAGLPGLPLAVSRFPAVGEQEGVPPTLQVYDLGPLWADPGLDLRLVARALVFVTAALVVQGG